jgi:hypothetical protein
LRLAAAEAWIVAHKSRVAMMVKGQILGNLRHWPYHRRPLLVR